MNIKRKVSYLSYCLLREANLDNFASNLGRLLALLQDRFAEFYLPVLRYLADFYNRNEFSFLNRLELHGVLNGWFVLPSPQFPILLFELPLESGVPLLSWRPSGPFLL